MHQDRVYLTENRDYARYYASLYGRGDLYLVEPLGELEPSTEDPFNCYVVPAARVLAVIDRAVLLRMSERRRIYVQHARTEGITKRQALEEFDAMLRNPLRFAQTREERET